MALNDEMSAVFKSSRTDLDSVPDNTVGVDPESGNEIPLGSLPEEVRDDIPAQLSEGEYVVPADVVRYYGVKFFEDLRAEAKFGYQDMEENGRIGGDPTGMEMVEPEDDMMFDMSELEVMEVPDEPVGAFFGGFFSKKDDKSPEEKVRERFDAASQREKQKRMQQQLKSAGYDSGNKTEPAAKSSSSNDGPSIAEQINFGGDYEDKPKDKKESAASKTVRKAYTGDEEPGFFDKIKQGIANDMKALGYAEGGYAGTGGYALSPGDEGYDEMGSLGLGSEGLPLGTGENIDADAVIEMVAYVNEEGRVIYIMHINGVPQNEVPPGFYIRTEEESTETSVGTGSQPTPQVVTQSDNDDDGPDMPAPTPIDYQNLTLDEMQELMDDMNSKTTKAVTLGVAAMAGPVGLLLKGAMMHQERTLRKEMERRLNGELTTQDRARLEGMLQESRNQGGIFGTLKGKVADLIIGEEQGPGMDIQPPKTYSPEVAAGSVTKALSPDIMSQINQAAKDAATAQTPEQKEAARRAKEAREAADAAAAAAAAQPASSGPYTADLAMQRENDRREAAADARRRVSEVASAAKSTGKSIQEVGKAIGPSSTKTETEKATGGQGNQGLGSGAGGMKKGGLASKKKKK